LVCDSCGLVISEGAIDEGPEWSAYSVEENDRLARTGAPRSYVAGASGLTTVIPLANKDARGNTIPLREREKFYRMRKLQRHSGHSRPALPADELREPVLLEAWPVEHRRGRGPEDPQGTREDRQFDVPVPLGHRGGRDLSRVPLVRGAPPAEGDCEDRGRQ